MKIYCLFIIFISSIYSTSNAFFWDPSSLDLYKSIEKWIVDLEEKTLWLELWWDDILKKINNFAKTEKDINKCLDEGKTISVEEIKEIVIEQKSWRIYNYISDSCLSFWKVPMNLYISYIEIFNKHYANSLKDSTEKTKQIYKINNIWLYTDWMLENSSFDLVNDIVEINEIIFSNNTDFTWEDDVDIESVLDWTSTSSSPSAYQKTTDNSEWPCQDFFCIIIDFITYDWPSWSEENENTIQFLINRSNEHLKNIVFWSLSQAKMTTDLFELWLKDLSLPDIFHLSVQVSYKPIPILDIEEAWKKNEDEFSAKWLLEKYYKNNSLDYKRRNDINLLKKSEEEKKSVLNSENLAIWNVKNKYYEYQEWHQKTEKKKVELLNKSIDKKVSYWLTENFEKQYTELEKFSLEIHDYTENLLSILKAMLDIPVDNWSG